MRLDRIIRIDTAILCALIIGVSVVFLIPLIEGEDDIALWNQDFSSEIMYATNSTVIGVSASDGTIVGEMNAVTIQDLKDTDDKISTRIYDDGTHGDMVANDGVYTGSFTIVDDEGVSGSRTDDTIDQIDIGDGYSVRVTVDLDHDGNSSFGDIVADFTAPEIVLLSDLTLPYGKIFPLEARVTDDHVDETTFRYIQDDEQPQAFETIIKDSDGKGFNLSSEVNILGLLDGTHMITIRVSDRAGNTRELSWDILVDNTAPAMDLTNISIDPFRRVVLNSTIDDPHLDPDSVMWRWNDGEWMVPEEIAHPNSFLFRLGFEFPLSGKNIVNVRGRDTANNTATGNLTFHYTEPRFQDLIIKAHFPDEPPYLSGKPFDLRLTIGNPGIVAIDFTLELLVDDISVDATQSVTIGPHTVSQWMVISWQNPEPGFHNMSIRFILEGIHEDDSDIHMIPVVAPEGDPILIQEDDTDSDDEFPWLPAILGGILVFWCVIGGLYFTHRKQTEQPGENEIIISGEPISIPPAPIEAAEIPIPDLPQGIMYPIPPPMQVPDPDSPPPQSEGDTDVPMVPLDSVPPSLMEDPTIRVQPGKPDLSPRQTGGRAPPFIPPVLPPGTMHPVPPPASYHELELKPVQVVSSNPHHGGDGETVRLDEGDSEPEAPATPPNEPLPLMPMSPPSDYSPLDPQRVARFPGPSPPPWDHIPTPTTTEPPSPPGTVPATTSPAPQSPAALPPQPFPEPIPPQHTPVPPVTPTPEPIQPPAESQCTDCCDEIRAQNNGILKFGSGDQSVELHGRIIKMTVNGVEQEWTLDFNLEDVFCNLGDHQIVGSLTTTTTSRSSGGFPKEEIASTNTTLSGPTPDTASTGLNQTLSFASQIIDSDGHIRESSISLTMDSEECSYQLQTMIDGQVNEYITEPPLDLRTLRRQWHHSDEGIWRNRGHQWARWWNEMWRFLLHLLWWEGWHQDHPNDDDAWLINDIRGQWKSHLREAVSDLIEHQRDLTAEQVRDIHEMEQALDSDASLSEIALKFLDLWNHFHEGIPEIREPW
jgi:hypothetical protein